MSTYVLIHGAGSDAWYWHRVSPLLRALGHDVVAPTLPSDGDLTSCAGAVVGAIDRADDVVVVGQSLAGFVAPLVCARVPTRLLVLVAAMAPAPGESASAWWANTGWDQVHAPIDEGFDPVHEFFHDVPADVTQAAMARSQSQPSSALFEQPWPLDSWPDVPTRFILCRDDRFFPADFQRRVVRDRLGIIPDEVDSGHLPALSCPEVLVERLEAYRTALS